ncbi:GNAT family N-acetyltransferase [Nocardioides caeni]|uniref:GNAT family N-acetyltransferase n=1 Tax=Nocardioides caeni TaxID=574700 RepID=A0A4S8N1Z7_9ACTN|nr:GNAT family N-acetyltransferase [Nocardioides caeni]THV09421.1 GNAT family N-acetyltransferase [Nocardioides caeni]
MRLTNVAHLRLPFGRLMGYDLQVSAPGAELPVSFDQGRHVGAGTRAGSWMALSFRLTGPHGLADIEEAWRAVVLRHGTLRTAFSPGSAGPRLHEVRIGEGSWREHPIAPGQAVNEALREVLDTACTSYAAPSHRLCVLETADGPTVVVAADHAHVDMWSMLVIARDLLAAMAARRSGQEPFAGDPAPPPFAAHTTALRERPQAPQDVRDRWAQILGDSGDVMPRFPMGLGESDGPQRERVEVRDVLDVDAAAALGAGAAQAGVSTLSIVVAEMTRVTRVLADEPLRAVFPVHSRFEPSWHDSVGWFITNSVIECDDPEPAGAAAAVKEAVHLGSWPLAEVLVPWGGMPEAPGMFAISWLDLRRLPVRLDASGIEAQYVGASILTDGVMLWFVLDDTGLHLRCRYPDTAEARRNVGRWLDRLIAGLRNAARADDARALTVAGTTYRIERARRSDVPAVVALLADDEIGAARESGDIARYEAAFDGVARDPAQFLAVVRDAGGSVVATMQLSIVAGLSRGGATRLQIEGVRVAAGLRGRGLGALMLDWAHDHGRARGATLAQLTTDDQRADALRFYARLGYDATHTGLKKQLRVERTGT